MKNVRTVTISCEAEKLSELLDLLDVEYVGEIIITRTQEEFNHDYQGETPIGLLEEDDDIKLDDLEIKLDDFEDDDSEWDDDDDSEWVFIWDN